MSLLRNRACRLLCPVALFLLAASGCGPSALGRPPATGEDTTLGNGDVFDVRVYGETDLSASYRVAQDGTIDFPYVGRVEVAELEPTQVADMLSERLEERGVLTSPQVSVFVTEYNSKRVTVTGAVGSSGSYPISQGLTAHQAVQLAGGTSERANGDGTILTRRVNGVMRRYAVPLDRITIGTAEDFQVRNGDIIFVPERAF